MKLKDFDYSLPKELIAQYPSQERDESRLLVLDRKTSRIKHRIFKDIVEYFHKGDLLVLNNTKVVPARLFGKKETGGKVEVLLLDARCSMLDAREKSHEALLRPARDCKIGTKLIFGKGALKAEVSRIEKGRRFLKFDCNGDFEKELDRFGEMPLPPYIKRNAVELDRERYQTIYAVKKGAVAAPTAGLHFTKSILDDISKKGVGIGYVTLHVGYGTFRPIKCEDVREHWMEKEYFEIEGGVFEKLKSKKGRTIAVGTTTCRVLETLFKTKPWTSRCPRLSLEQGWTDLFIYPPYEFKAIDVLLTNFHLPKTTLLMLVSAFCGKELLFKAYKEAINEKYRFYSYGDAMLIV